MNYRPPQEDDDLPIYRLADARKRLENLRQFLPTSVSLATLGVRSKTPFHILCVREALAWRTEEFSRTACDAIEKGDVASGMLLTRAVMESTACIWRLRKLLVTRAQRKTEEVQAEALSMFAGSKNGPEFAKSINILTLIDDLNKTIPLFRNNYDTFSEVAHPNYSGVVGLFAEIDRPSFVMNFARGWSRNEVKPQSAIEILATCLDLFILVYNEIADQMQGYLAELEPL